MESNNRCSRIQRRGLRQAFRFGDQTHLSSTLCARWQLILPRVCAEQVGELRMFVTIRWPLREQSRRISTQFFALFPLLDLYVFIRSLPKRMLQTIQFRSLWLK